jgi:hypothetical protein
MRLNCPTRATATAKTSANTSCRLRVSARWWRWWRWIRLTSNATANSSGLSRHARLGRSQSRQSHGDGILAFPGTEGHARSRAGDVNPCEMFARCIVKITIRAAGMTRVGVTIMHTAGLTLSTLRLTGQFNNLKIPLPILPRVELQALASEPARRPTTQMVPMPAAISSACCIVASTPRRRCSPGIRSANET